MRMVFRRGLRGSAPFFFCSRIENIYTRARTISIPPVFFYGELLSIPLRLAWRVGSSRNTMAFVFSIFFVSDVWKICSRLHRPVKLVF